MNEAERKAAEAGSHEVRLYTNVKMTENLTYYAGKDYKEVGRWEDDEIERVYFAKAVSRETAPN